MTDFEDALQAAKMASVGQLLVRCARLFNEEATARFPVPEGAPKLRTSHTAVFPHIDLAGTRATEIARRMGISKQAVGQLLAELEAMEAIVRVPDPTDRRARLVKFNDAPGRSLLDGMQVLIDLEAELAETVGERLMRELKAGLIQLMSVLEARALQGASEA